MSTALRERLARHDSTLTLPASISVAEMAAGVRIIHVEPGSLAEAAEVRVGEVLLSINGEGIRDTVDFFFHGSDDDLDLEVRDEAGITRRVLIEKEWPEESLGIEVEQFVTQNCGCNCVFCFVHQLPDAMRKTLYIKDEDYRLSFMQGSYITGVTLKHPDLERIAKQRLTPLYLSVHSVEEDLRRWLLGIKKALPIRELLDFFRANRITVHTQIVLCPGKNDGAHLEETLNTLASYHPTVASAAIVPVGLTKWRDGLPGLTPVDADYARAFLAEWRPKLRAIEKKFGRPFAMFCDEWFLIAGLKTPSYSRYRDMPQLENGVGMVYHFYKDMAKASRALPAKLDRPWRVAAITSTLSPPVLARVIDRCERCEGLSVTPLPTKNTVFGETIHVTGLLCGVDLKRAIVENPGYDQYLLPGSCLRKYDARFLDDMTLDELRRDTGALVSPVLGGSLDFIETILEGALGRHHEAPKDHPFLLPHWSIS